MMSLHRTTIHPTLTHPRRFHLEHHPMMSFHPRKTHPTPNHRHCSDHWESRYGHQLPSY